MIRHYHVTDLDDLEAWQLEELLEDIDREMRHARRNGDRLRYAELHSRHRLVLEAYEGEREFEAFEEWLEAEAELELAEEIVEVLEGDDDDEDEGDYDGDDDIF